MNKSLVLAIESIRAEASAKARADDVKWIREFIEDAQRVRLVAGELSADELLAVQAVARYLADAIVNPTLRS